MCKYFSYISYFSRDDSLVDIDSGSNFSSNRASALPWMCSNDKCSGGAISVYGTSRLIVRKGSFFESNRQDLHRKARD